MRVGVVGCGRWGRNIVRDLVGLAVEVHVADGRPDRRAEARVIGAEATVEHADDLVACDGYVVATEASHHREVCLALLARSAPVFVEKPPGASLNDARALAAHGDGRLFVMHKWRYHPGVKVLTDLLNSGELGDPLRLETIRIGIEPLPRDANVLWHLGAHDLSIALHLGLLAESTAAFATRRDSDGRLLGCECSMLSDRGFEHRMVLGAAAPNRLRSVMVQGSCGSATLPSPESATIDLRIGGSLEPRPVPLAMPLALELEAFVDHLAGGSPPLSDIDSALEIVQRLAGLDAMMCEPTS
jgi:predicted dehydrogenase